MEEYKELELELNKLEINLYDNKGLIRPMLDVLEELSEIWDSAPKGIINRIKAWFNKR